LSYVAEQEDAGYPAYVTVRRPKGEVLAKLGYGLRFELPASPRACHRARHLD
jgi:hypothetical protein